MEKENSAKQVNEEVKKEVEKKVKEQAVSVSRYLITHKHTPVVASKEPAKPVLKKTDIRITRAKRLLEQIERYKQQATEAETELETNGAVDLFEEAKAAADWIEMKACVANNMAAHLLECSDAAGVAAERYYAEAEQKQNEARKQVRLAVDMQHEAKRFADEATKILHTSKSTGEHAELKQVEKNLETVRHRLRKRIREATNKAEKYKKKLAVLMEELGPLLDTLEGENIGTGTEGGTDGSC